MSASVKEHGSSLRCVKNAKLNENDAVQHRNLTFTINFTMLFFPEDSGSDFNKIGDYVNNSL